MKKIVVSVVVLVLASLYLMTKSLIHAVYQAYKDLEPYIGMVSMVQMAVFISISVVGFGLLGAFIAVMK